MKVNSGNLYELINDEIIKANTKIKVYYDDVYKTTITFDGYDFIWETGTFRSGMLFNPLCDFEIIEEDKPIEKISGLQHPLTKSLDLIKKDIELAFETIDKLIDKVNELKKENE